MKRPARPPRRAAASLLPLAAALVLVGPAHAAAPACAPAPGEATVTLNTVSDAGDVVLADGRLLRLAGLDLVRATASSPDRPARLRAALLAWAAGPVTLHLLAAASDRWGRLPALLFRADPPGEAGTALLAEGLARVAPEASAHACTAPRLVVEDTARAQARGIWADPASAVLAPGDAAGLAAQAGGLAIVAGLLRVHESHGALYLALGRDRSGFAAVVSRRDVKTFARAGLDLRDYEGTPVRLRGDLDARFGPRMRLTDPDAVESLEPGSIAEDASAPAKHWTVPPEPR